MRTYLERDLPQIGSRIPARTLERFWSMLAHYHGQTWNASELARSFGIGEATVRRYVDLLAGTFMIRLLPPWHENLGKRLVKSPKLYICDSGLLHALLRIPDRWALERNPRVGASWEGLALAAVEQRLGTRREDSYFWGTHAGAELDLLVMHGSRRLGFEFKRSTAPSVTRSMKTVLQDLDLERIDVVHAGKRTFMLGDRIRALALSGLGEDLAPLT